MGFRNLPEMKPNNKPQFAGVGFDFGGGETDHPVTSVNGETGTVVLDAADVGALPADTTIPTKTSDLENDSGFVDSDIIAPVEATSTASQAYTVGQYFINSLGQLCRVTVDIASGGTITVGTNCVVEPVGTALTSLNSKNGNIAYSGNSWSDVNTTYNLGVPAEAISGATSLLLNASGTGIQAFSIFGANAYCLVLRWHDWGQGSVVISGGTINMIDYSFVVLSKGYPADSYRISLIP